MTLHVVGGLYREVCIRPHWDHVFGSAGRAAAAISSFGYATLLHTCSTKDSLQSYMPEVAGLQVSVASQNVDAVPSFRYLYDSAPPSINDFSTPQHTALSVTGEKVLRFGMLECETIVDAEWAVYDPQNVGAPEAFGKNGSKAKRLALVLNSYEACLMADLPAGTSPEVCADLLGRRDDAEVVVVKMGPAGALVWTREVQHTVPAYRTSRVWKIGSGDTFAAHFALAWMEQGRSPAEAAELASRATAFYCENRVLPTPELLEHFEPEVIATSKAFRAGHRPQVYLAGPFFDIAQLWLVEEARARLSEFGFKVFSPFHDVGLGTADDVVHLDLEAIHRCDIMFAIADGIDAGTLYEVGYARAIDKPVIVLSERESDESLKMAQGSGCLVSRDFTTALYNTLWEAARE